MLDRDNSNENYYCEGDHSVQQMLDETYAQAININQAYWTEADLDNRFKIGDQSLWTDYYGNLPAYRRKQFYFNRIRRVCNLITGYQRRNRKSTVAVPVEHNDDEAATLWSKLLYHTMKEADADEMISEAFEMGSVTTGMSLLNCWMDYQSDPINGDIRLDHVPYNAFLIDPYFRKRDLSDCNFIWRRKWMTRDAVKGIVPSDLGGFIDSLSPRGNRDGKFQYMAESFNYSMNNLLSYDEYWYLDQRPAKFLVDPRVQMSKEWKGEEEELDLYMRLYPQLEIMEKEIQTVKVALVVEGKTVYNGPNIMKLDKYPFIPMIGYYEPNVSNFAWRTQGVVRNLRDSQFLYNRRKIIELDIMESQVNSGFKYKPSSLVNPRDIFLEGQGKGIAIKQEADINDVQEIQPGQIPSSMIQLSEILGREIQEISGVNEELLGSATDDKAGILSMLRQGAGLTTLQVLFDGLDQSQKLLGELFVELIQKHYSPAKVQRITNLEPGKEFENKLFLKYDLRIEEGVNTTTQRQMAFAQKLHLREIGVPIPTENLLEDATMQNKGEVIETIVNQEKQQAQMQQAQMEAQLQLLQAQIQDLQAKAISNQGLGVERLSRVEENRLLAEERRTQAIENIEEARLAKVKMMAEIDDMDLNKIQKLLEIANMIQVNQDAEGKPGFNEVPESEEIMSPLGL